MVHFAVDDHEVRFCTHLKGKDSWFLPFNLGWNDGAGNPPNPDGIKTDYLWKRVLIREGLTNILENYAQVVETRDERTRRKRAVQIWPRFHQLDAVRRLLADADAKKLLPNASYFAFTATPKNKTFEIFGAPKPQPDGRVKHEPFHSYTMKQAIEEGFILDVLRHYTPVDSYYRLVKRVEGSNAARDSDIRHPLAPNVSVRKDICHQERNLDSASMSRLTGQSVDRTALAAERVRRLQRGGGRSTPESNRTSGAAGNNRKITGARLPVGKECAGGGPFGLQRFELQFRTVVAQAAFRAMLLPAAYRSDLSKQKPGNVVSGPAFEEYDIPGLQEFPQKVGRPLQVAESVDRFWTETCLNETAGAVFAVTSDQYHLVAGGSDRLRQPAQALPLTDLRIGTIREHEDAASSLRLAKNIKRRLNCVNTRAEIVPQNSGAVRKRNLLQTGGERFEPLDTISDLGQADAKRECGGYGPSEAGCPVCSVQAALKFGSFAGSCDPKPQAVRPTIGHIMYPHVMLRCGTEEQDSPGSPRCHGGHPGVITIQHGGAVRFHVRQQIGFLSRGLVHGTKVADVIPTHSQNDGHVRLNCAGVPQHHARPVSSCL